MASLRLAFFKRTIEVYEEVIAKIIKNNRCGFLFIRPVPFVVVRNPVFYGFGDSNEAVVMDF